MTGLEVQSIGMDFESKFQSGDAGKMNFAVRKVWIQEHHCGPKVLHGV